MDSKILELLFFTVNITSSLQWLYIKNKATAKVQCPKTKQKSTLKFKPNIGWTSRERQALGKLGVYFFWCKLWPHSDSNPWPREKLPEILTTKIQCFDSVSLTNTLILEQKLCFKMRAIEITQNEEVKREKVNWEVAVCPRTNAQKRWSKNFP